MYYHVTEDCPNSEPDETKLGSINTIALERALYKVCFLCVGVRVFVWVCVCVCVCVHACVWLCKKISVCDIFLEI